MTDRKQTTMADIFRCTNAVLEQQIGDYLPPKQFAYLIFQIDPNARFDTDLLADGDQFTILFSDGSKAVIHNVDSSASKH